MTQDPLLGRILDGRYKVIRMIGRGGMGRVYEGEHVGLDKRVAIKVLADLGNEDAVVRFRREAKAAGKVTHAHVVQIFDVARDAGGTDFLVMEYFEGKDLRQALANKRLEPARVIAIARQILDGLGAIHAAGIVHRDIKPANILIATNGGVDVVKLTDFGIAKSIRGHDAQITAVGKVVGTYEYMAPESLLGEDVDERADIYAVGLTLYAMLAGELPFDSQTTDTIIATHLAGTLPRLGDKRPDLPKPLVAAVTRALSQAKQDRFASAAELADALDHRPRSEDTQSPRRRRWPVLVVGALLLSLIAVAVVWWFPNDRTEGSEHEIWDAPPEVEQARAAEEAGDLQLAIAQYQAAFARWKNSRYLYLIAELHQRLGNYADAAEFFQRYLDATPGAQDRARVLDLIAILKPDGSEHEHFEPSPPVDSGGTVTIDAQER